MSEGAEAAFIRHVLGLQWQDLPASAQQSVKTFLLDSVGVGIAGSGAPLTEKIRTAASQWAGPGCAHVWGRGSYATTPANAAFINGFQIHCQEFDCVHEPAVLHPMATILAALMATAQAAGEVSGSEFGAALAASVDVAAGLGMAARTPLKFFRPATAGIFGAVLGCCRLRSLSEAEARAALGYALAFASGTMQAHAEGKPALPVQIANAARGAVMACDLAVSGMDAAERSLEGPFGYLALYEDETDLTGILPSLGKIFRISEVSHKPFPTGRAAQGGIALAIKARASGIRVEDIASATLFAPPLIMRLVGRRPHAGMSANYARLCFAYSGALAFIGGHVGLSDFMPESLDREDVTSLSQRITVTENDQTHPAAFTPQTLRVRLHSGSEVEFSTDSLPGSPSVPLSAKENVEKFRACCAFGFGAPQADIEDALIHAVTHLETLRDAGRISRLAAGTME